MPAKLDQDASPDEKLLKLYSLLLFTGKEYSLTELKEELMCSKQTIGRLVNKLEKSYYGSVVVKRKGKENYYSLKKPSKGLHVSINPDGLRKMILCSDLMWHLLSYKTRDQIEASTLQAQANLPTEDLPSFNDVHYGYSFTKGKINYDVCDIELNDLEKSIASRKCCEILYQQSVNGECKRYTIAPMKLIAFRETLYIGAWCVTRVGKVEKTIDNPMFFLVHRMQKVEVLSNRSSEKLPEIDFSNETFGFIKSEPIKVKIFFKKKVATYVYDRKWSDDQKITLNDDGSLLLEFTSGNKYEVISFVLGFGQNAVLLEPASLKDEIAKEIETMQKAYAKS
jgi:predicted DNA-binding transcriptional regulator YafY